MANRNVTQMPLDLKGFEENSDEVQNEKVRLIKYFNYNRLETIKIFCTKSGNVDTQIHGMI